MTQLSWLTEVDMELFRRLLFVLLISPLIAHTTFGLTSSEMQYSPPRKVTNSKAMQEVKKSLVCFQAMIDDTIAHLGIGSVVKVEGDYVYAITNEHVIRNAPKIYVRPFCRPSNLIECDLIGYSAIDDLALVGFLLPPTCYSTCKERGKTSPEDALKPINFLDSISKDLEADIVGIWCRCQNQNRLVSGYVCFVEQDSIVVYLYQSLYSGQSGAPIFLKSDGRVIGIVSRGYQIGDTNKSNGAKETRNVIAVPANLIKSFLNMYGIY
jgi:hypothetical protein